MIDHDYKGTGRATDGESAASQSRNNKSGDDRSNQSFVGSGTAGDSQRHCQRQGNDRDGEARDKVVSKIVRTIALPEHGIEFGDE